MGFDDRLWIHLVEEHDAHDAVGPAPSRRRRPAARRALAAGVAVSAAIVAGVLVLAQSSGESAWARRAIRRAAAVVIPPASSRTILHVAGTETLSPLAQRGAATRVSTLTEQAWIQQGAPGGERQIMQVPGGPVLESDSQARIYNATSNTLYPGTPLPSRARYTLTPTGNAGDYRLGVNAPHGGVDTQTVDAATAKALRDGSDGVIWEAAWDGHAQTIAPVVVPSTPRPRQAALQQPNPASIDFAAALHALLDSGHARVARTTTADGRPAIEISSVHPQSGPRTNYYVDPRTYAPIELDSFGYDSPKDVIRVHITAYQTLPLAGHRRLLHLDVPASAGVDRTPADYWHAAGLPRPF